MPAMLETVFILSLLVASAILLWRGRDVAKKGRGAAQAAGRAVPWVALLGAAGLIARAAVWQSHSLPRHVSRASLKHETPAEDRDGDYVSAAGCLSCHPGHHASWHRTYHRTMTQVATPEAVLGDFDDHRVEYDNVEYLLFRRGEEYWARMTPVQGGQRGISQDVQLVMTTGSHHYQVYWTGEGPDRRLTEFPLAWLKERSRWIPREAALIMPPQLKQRAVVWNGVCIRCHSTHSQPRVTPQLTSELVDTSSTDLGIACEACHGPGAAHVRANQDPLRRYAKHFAGNGDETIVNPARLTADRSAQACGQCHAIASFSPNRQDWQRGHWNDFQPGKDLDATRSIIRPNSKASLIDLEAQLEQDPEFLRSYYWKDNMVRVSGREYNGLIDSPCFQGGKFSCLSCHSMHASDPDDQLASRMETDHACLQCHEDFRDKLAEHTHHAPDSAGSRCYNCHMPHTTYGLLKAIRSHQVSSPSVETSVKTGRPNACNQCHLDKSLGWTQERLAEWYGTPSVELDDDQATLSAMAVMLLRGDAGQRALAAWSMGWEDARKASGDNWQAHYLAQLLDDPYPAVRYIAERSLRRLSGQADFHYDFVGPQRQRQAAQQQVRATWQRAGGGPPFTGGIDQAAWDRLLKQRDDRDIDLKE